MKWLLLVSLLFGLFTAKISSAVEGPRFVVHILNYIALDYAGAVGAKGKVLNNDEYTEQNEFAVAALDAARKSPELVASASLLTRLEGLKALIEQKASPEVVSTEASGLSQEIIRATNLAIAPRHWPDIAHGKVLYDQSCTQCHGATGHGDGPSSGGLNPPPSNFHDAKMEGISPFQMFNTIRMGVPGTGMAAFDRFSDKEIWDLAFFLSAFRHEKPLEPIKDLSVELSKVASTSDEALKAELGADFSIKGLRWYQPGMTASEGALALAKKNLEDAFVAYQKNDFDLAKNKAVLAYLDGVEPIEPSLRNRDLKFITDIERSMMQVRSGIDQRVPEAELKSRIDFAFVQLTRAGEILARSESSWWVTFSLASGIFLREAFEATLIIVTLLGVVRTMGQGMAAMYIHAGWALAVGIGLLGWVFSGWLMKLSGAGREVLEGTVSFIAVVVLFYFGFWLHRKTEMGKWREFIQEMVETAIQKKNLYALGAVAFMGVFREAFETVLFLRALLLESGPQHESALGLGVAWSFVLVVALSWWAVRQSAKLPVRQLFLISSWVMFFLAFTLIGKGVHAFQEVGMIAMSPTPWEGKSDLLGIFPYWESILAQVTLSLLTAGLIWFNHRSPAMPVPAAKPTL